MPHLMSNNQYLCIWKNYCGRNLSQKEGGWCAVNPSPIAWLLMELKCWAGQGAPPCSVTKERRGTKAVFDRLSPIHPDPERNLTYSSFHSLRRTDEPGKIQELIAIHLGTNTDTHILRIPLGAYLPQVAYYGLMIYQRFGKKVPPPLDLPVGNPFT